MQTFVLILATTVLTCSSVAGFYFLIRFGAAAVFSRGVTAMERLRCGILAVLACAISVGSGRLLSYIFSRV